MRRVTAASTQMEPCSIRGGSRFGLLLRASVERGAWHRLSYTGLGDN